MHEFVHMIHNLALLKTQPETMNTIYAAYVRAAENGHFLSPPTKPSSTANALADSRDDEYFTISVNAYYNLNEKLPGRWVDVEVGGWSNRPGTRDELRRNDPVLYKIIESIFPESRIEL